ncbi:hypothetical protein UlMin_016744 [Ulmus minor]
MARSSFSVATTVLVATLLLFSTGVLAQAPASAPGAAGPAAAPASADCVTLVTGTADCLSYVTKGSNLTVPDKPCCPELKTLVDTNATCLCELLAQSANYGLEIDLKRATKLPSVCKVDTPPISTCAVLGIPVAGAPLASPGPSPGGEPSEGSTVAPSPTKNNAASAVAVPSVLALLLVFALSFLPTFF